MKRNSSILLCLFALFSTIMLAAQPKINLAGEWRFALDRTDKGVSEQWFTKKLSETVKLPGSMADNGKGDEVTLTTPWTGCIFDSSWYFNPAMAKYRKLDNLKIPFWLTPVKHYVGVAWYQREISIPKSWTGKVLRLLLERPHWQTTVWLDDKIAGKQNSLSVPHEFTISAFTPGKHTLTVRIDNRCNEIDPGNNSHSITDNTQGNWNGIIGRMELQSIQQLNIADVQIYPDLATKSIKAVVVIKRSGMSSGGVLQLAAKPVNCSATAPKSMSIKYTSLADTTTIVYPMGDKISTWDEFSPSLYNLKVILKDATGKSDTKEVIFGMREYKIKGTRFEINGRPIFLRGNVDCCVFPLTGYPPTDEAAWTRIYKICKAHGLNHVRFHSYCPPEVAFTAADKAGFYLQVEGPSWASYTTTLGGGKPIDQYTYDETERILKEYGNHPSFCMMAYGNEPKGNYVPYLNKYVTYWKSKDNRHVYTGASTGASWKVIPESEFFVRAKPRGISWKANPETVFDFGDKLEELKKPYLTHEMGQWCVFPNFDEIAKYKGTLKPKNMELFQEDLADKHLAAYAHDFLMASGKLQALCYKQEIEGSLRTPGLAGFQLLGLNDFPGQGSALVGVLDAFWDEKGYVTPQEYSQFCNSTVPLARMAKFVYKNNETFSANIEVAHFGAKPLRAVRPTWKITSSNGTIVATGELDSKDISIGNCIALGAVNYPLTTIMTATQLTFQVSINEFSNKWDFWVYPATLPAIDSTAVYTCTALDSTAEATLQKGGKVLLLASGKVENGKDVVQFYTPVFWNTSWFKMRPPHTTGILVKPELPVFANFPTDYWSNLQWAEITHQQQVMNLENFPADFRPLIMSIDTWFLNRRLSMLFEAKVGAGKLIVCSIDLQTNLDKRIVARQLKYSIDTYMRSEKFAPETEIDIRIIKELFEVKERKAWNSYTKEIPADMKKVVN